MDLTTPMIITNTDQYHLAPTYNDSVIAGDTEVLKCNKKIEIDNEKPYTYKKII